MEVRLYSYWCEFRAEELIGFDPTTHEQVTDYLGKYQHPCLTEQPKVPDLQPLPHTTT